MKVKEYNMRVIAENNGNRDGFNIYLDFSGQREFLMYHRHNGLLFGLLKNGMRTEALRRWTPSRAAKEVCSFNRKRVCGRMNQMVRHLLEVVDDYLFERAAACGEALPQPKLNTYEPNEHQAEAA